MTPLRLEPAAPRSRVKHSSTESLRSLFFRSYPHLYEYDTSRGTKVEKMLTLAPERYTAGFCMVAKVILWCI